MEGDDESLLRLFIRNWKKDYDEGVTLRSVHNRVTGMDSRFSTQMREHDRRLMQIEAERKAEHDVEAKTNPGLGNVPTPQAFPAPSIAVTVGSTGTGVASGGSHVSQSGGAGSSSPPKSASKDPIGPWLRVFQPSIGKAVLVVLSLLAGALAHHFGLPAPAPQVIYLPAPSSSAAGVRP